MVIANPRIHIICGVCGSNKMFSFKINPKGNCGYDGNEYPAVFISCENCSTLTRLDEVMKEKTVESKKSLDVLKRYLQENNITFFEGTDILQEIGRPTVDWIQLPSRDFIKIYEPEAECYLDFLKREIKSE